MTVKRTPIVEEDVRHILADCNNELLGLSGKTILITGASGFVGSYLVESVIASNLLRKGSEPCRLLLPTRSLVATQQKWPHFFGHKEIAWFEWDGQAPIPVGDECNFIIHAASPTDTSVIMRDPYATMRDMVRTTEQVATYARRVKVTTLLYLSSGAAYGVQPESMMAIPEAYMGAPDLTDARSCYGEAKRYSELLLRTSGLATVVARLFSFVGPYQDMAGSYAMTDFIRQAREHGRIRVQGDGTPLRTYCYASDLCVALWKLLLNGVPNEVYNVGGDLPAVSILELARLVAGVTGVTDVEVLKKDVSAGNNRSRYIPDITKLKQFCIPKTDISTGIARTIQSNYG